MLKAGIVTYFSRRGLELRASDPPTYDADALDIDITRKRFFEDYYNLFLQLVDNNDSHSLDVGDFTYRAVHFPVADVFVGLPTDLINAPVDAVPQKATIGEGFYAGPDGIIVKLGETWSVDRMQLEPHERRRLV